MSSPDGVSRKLTVVLAGGGTGGHVYPALALGEALQARGHRLVYFGDASRLEGTVVPKRGMEFVPIPALMYPRAGLVAKLRFALGLASSVWTARKLLRQHDAGFVLGVGGYISAPPVLAAWTLGIPRAVHEANVTPGMANKLCARVADLVLLTYAQSGPRLPGSAPRETVGSPVNPKMLDGDRAAAAARYGLDPDQPVLLVVGGSNGALTINKLAVAIATWPERSFQVAIVTGPRYFDDVQRQLNQAAGGAGLPPGVGLVDYEHHMADALALADLVLARSGASTLAELCVLGKPSVLVPSPNVAENHQEGNARGLEQVGAAVVFTESELLDGEALRAQAALAALAGLMADPDRLGAMGAAAQAEGKPDTAERVADLIEQRFAR